jgi:hypothetical protein
VELLFVKAAENGGPPKVVTRVSERLEVDDKAGGDAGAIGVAAGSGEADVVQLGTESQVWK